MKCLTLFLRLMSLIGLMIILPLMPIPLKAQNNVTSPKSIGLKTSLKFEHITQEEGLPSLAVWDTVQDQQGFMWFATGNGLCRYDGYAFKTYYNDPKDPHSISSEDPIKLYIDRQGILWVGTWYSGLNVFEQNHGTFYSLPAR